MKDIVHYEDVEALGRPLTPSYLKIKPPCPHRFDKLINPPQRMPVNNMLRTISSG